MRILDEAHQKNENYRFRTNELQMVPRNRIPDPYVTAIISSHGIGHAQLFFCFMPAIPGRVDTVTAFFLYLTLKMTYLPTSKIIILIPSQSLLILQMPNCRSLLGSTRSPFFFSNFDLAFAGGNLLNRRFFLDAIFSLLKAPNNHQPLRNKHF